MVFRISIVAIAAMTLTGCAQKHAEVKPPAAPPIPASAPRIQNVANISTFSQDRIARAVQRALVNLPYYGVFDNLAFSVEGETVTIYGQVTRPELKIDAEDLVRQIEGVGRVVNEIRVLPISADDDRLRLAEYRAIYSTPGLERYAMMTVPPIHIIVDNGKVTLEGVVATKADKKLVGIQADSVPGVAPAANNLTVQP